MVSSTWMESSDGGFRVVDRVARAGRVGSDFIQGVWVRSSGFAPTEGRDATDPDGLHGGCAGLLGGGPRACGMDGDDRRPLHVRDRGRGGSPGGFRLVRWSS